MRKLKATSITLTIIRKSGQREMRDVYTADRAGEMLHYRPDQIRRFARKLNMGTQIADLGWILTKPELDEIMAVFGLGDDLVGGNRLVVNPGNKTPAKKPAQQSQFTGSTTER